MPPIRSCRFPIRPDEPRYVKCNHILHLLLTIVTGGLWIVAWAMIAYQTTISGTFDARRTRRIWPSTGSPRTR